MINAVLGRIGGLASPLLAKLVFWLAAVALSLCGALWFQSWRLGELQEDFDLAKAEAKAAAAAAKATVDLLNAEREGTEAKIAAAVAQALLDRPAEVRTATRIVEKLSREDPTFAAAVRPADLAALRVQQLKDVDEANGH